MLSAGLVLNYEDYSGSVEAQPVDKEQPPSVQQSADQAKAMAVAKEFEHNFASIMWELAMKDVNDDSGATQLYRSWLNNEYSKNLAPKMGLADNVYRKIIELQKLKESESNTR